MSFKTLLNVRLFAGGADLTGQSNKVELILDVSENDVTTFLPEDDPDSGWKKVGGGLLASAIAAEGLWNAGDDGMVDDHHFANMGSRVAFTIAPDGASAGDLCYLTQALRAQYKLGGQVGQAHPWAANASGTGVVSRGVVLNPPGVARTTTGTGTGVQFGAVTSDQTLYANSHVLSVSGTSVPTITFTVESDDNSGFTTATSRISFAGQTAIGSLSSSVAGPITDDWWRVSYTVSGSTPSFLAVVSIGLR